MGLTKEWDLEIPTALQEMDIGVDTATTQFWSEITDADTNVTSSPSNRVVTAAASFSISCGLNEERDLRDIRVYNVKLRDLIHQSSMSDEERRVVESAITQLCIDVIDPYSPLDPTTRDRNSETRIWQLLLDEEWRSLSVKGVYMAGDC
jgi:hypothetical protein